MSTVSDEKNERKVRVEQSVVRHCVIMVVVVSVGSRVQIMLCAENDSWAWFSSKLMYVPHSSPPEWYVGCWLSAYCTAGFQIISVIKIKSRSSVFFHSLYVSLFIYN